MGFLPKCLITGANGLLGSNLSLQLSEKFQVIATDVLVPSIPGCCNLKLDITDNEDIKKISEVNPDYIIHCAALVDVDYCETAKEEAWLVNAKGSENVAKAAADAGSYLVYISTDSVFDGKQGNYQEMDVPNPVNNYAKSKLNAELLVQKACNNYCIVRTNIYGWNRQSKNSIAEWMLESLLSGRTLTGFKDVFFSPILVNNLADALIELFSEKHRGILHISGSERVSKLEFASLIAEAFSLNKQLITPISIDSLKLRADRPKDTSLNVLKAQSLLKTRLLNASEGIALFKELKENGFVERLKHGA
jgi:dTDP-4-dehydrorhamnose reductase